MSFRVWFLRMVWIVAAAVALSGCPGDDDGNENGTDGKGDGPSLAIGKIGNVTMGGDNEKATIKVTITSKDDADKTAEVTLSVKCGDKDAIEKKMDAVAGKADFGKVDLGNHDEAADCTADASATLGGKKVEATQVKFEIVDATVTGPSLTLAIHDDSSGSIDAMRTASSSAITEEGKVHAKVVVIGKKNNKDVAATDLEVSWNCATTDAPSVKLFSADNIVTMVAATAGEFTGMITLDDGANTDKLADAVAHTCTISASIEDVSGSEKTETVKVTGATG